ncbi:MAG TPA: hypothetical protein VHI10_18325 [Mycobacterium sp.]|nr:hypothetical protein [Mycobacterium sp.]
MSNLERRMVRLVVTGAAALGFLIAPTALMSHTAAQPVVRDQAGPCYNGVIPGNPYIQPCNSPPRKPKVRGGTADQWAVIACRDIPGCLSWYINNPH